MKKWIIKMYLWVNYIVVSYLNLFWYKLKRILMQNAKFKLILFFCYLDTKLTIHPINDVYLARWSILTWKTRKSDYLCWKFLYFVFFQTQRSDAEENAAVMTQKDTKINWRISVKFLLSFVIEPEFVAEWQDIKSTTFMSNCYQFVNKLCWRWFKCLRRHEIRS